MDPSPTSQSPGGSTGGDRPPRRLDRAPATRYASSAAVPAAEAPRGSLARGIGLGVLAAVVAGVVLFLAGNLDLGAGLVALSAAAGWALALALVGGGMPAGVARTATAATLALVAVAGAFLALALWAQVEGGVLSPVDYVAERFGPLAAVDAVVAVAVAVVRAR